MGIFSRKNKDDKDDKVYKCDKCGAKLQISGSPIRRMGNAWSPDYWSDTPTENTTVVFTCPSCGARNIVKPGR